MRFGYEKTMQKAQTKYHKNIIHIVKPANWDDCTRIHMALNCKQRQCTPILCIYYRVMNKNQKEIFVRFGILRCGIEYCINLHLLTCVSLCLSLIHTDIHTHKHTHYCYVSLCSSTSLHYRDDDRMRFASFWPHVGALAYCHENCNKSFCPF